MRYQVSTSKQLLDRASAAPVARKPEAARLVPDGDGDLVAAARFARVGHRDLQGGIAIDGERNQGVGDVLDTRLAVECSLAGRRIHRERGHRVALDLVNVNAVRLGPADDRVDVALQVRPGLVVFYVEPEVVLLS